jgi:hypothetical protein
VLTRRDTPLAAAYALAQSRRRWVAVRRAGDAGVARRKGRVPGDARHRCEPGASAPCPRCGANPGPGSRTGCARAPGWLCSPWRCAGQSLGRCWALAMVRPLAATG